MSRGQRKEEDRLLEPGCGGGGGGREEGGKGGKEIVETGCIGQMGTLLM